MSQKDPVQENLGKDFRLHPALIFRYSMKGEPMREVVFRLPLVIIALLLAADSAISVQGPATQNLAHVKTIYVVPMKGGMNHYVTNELVQWGRFQVTLDPHQADALLSDTTKVDISAIMTDPKKLQKTVSTRGTLFLIDLKTEKVIWTVYKKPYEPYILGGDKSSPELAHDMITALKKDLGLQK